MTRVANVRDTREGEYVGRASRSAGLAASPLGNPFVIGRTADGDRAAVIAKYERWLRGKLADPAIAAEIDRLAALSLRGGGVTLLCWCKPAACHGDVIAKVIAERLAEAAP